MILVKPLLNLLPPLHDFVLAVASTVSGWFASILLLAAVDPTPAAPPAAWYEHPAVLAAIFSGIFLMASKKYETWKAERRAEAEAEDEEDGRHLSLTEKREELASSELRDYLAARDRVHDRELAIEKNLNREQMVQLHESRLIRHALGNYVQSCHIYIARVREAIATCDVQIPDWDFKPYDDIIAGVDEKVERYRDALKTDPAAPKPL